jgi:hypothetical protein
MTPDPNAVAWPAIVALYIWSVFEQLHPGAASGASFGCFFLLALPDPVKTHWLEVLARKVCLLIFSWGLGYGAAEGHASGGGHYAILIGCATAALAAAIFGALNLMVRNDGPLPIWLKAIMDRIPVLKRGDDGS